NVVTAALSGSGKTYVASSGSACVLTNVCVRFVCANSPSRRAFTSSTFSGKGPRSVISAPKPCSWAGLPRSTSASGINTICVVIHWLLSRRCEPGGSPPEFDLWVCSGRRLRPARRQPSPFQQLEQRRRGGADRLLVVRRQWTLGA